MEVFFWNLNELTNLIECTEGLMLEFLNEVVGVSKSFKVVLDTIETRDELTKDELKDLQKYVRQAILSFDDIQKINSSIKNDIIYINELLELTHIHFLEFLETDCTEIFFEILKITGFNENGITKLFK